MRYSQHPIGAAQVAWRGQITSVQPRVRLTRSFDQRSHSYLGYTIVLNGEVGAERGAFSVAIGEDEYAKHQLRVGDEVAGVAEPVAGELPELHKIAQLTVARRADEVPAPPPWQGVAPALAVYQERGHRRLDARTYDSRCTSCIWGCRMPVEMIIDHWDPSQKSYRTETFCYGPLSCPSYKAGPTRTVPGRKGMTWEEDDWVDQDAVSHRDPDE